jgi:hypothetical protein
MSLRGPPISRAVATSVRLPFGVGRSGGMADAADLNSAAREGVRVQIPAPAPQNHAQTSGPSQRRVTRV